MKTYAGIGARNTPQDILELMAHLATQLADLGWLLRTGAATGADSAFEAGCDGSKGAKEIYLPWEGYNGRGVLEGNVYVGATALTIGHALHYHPNPVALASRQGVKKLHARNCAIVCGLDMDDPVDMVICWTPYGEVVGGTSQAMRVAIDNGIPIFNLALDEDWEKLDHFVGEI